MKNSMVRQSICLLAYGLLVVASQSQSADAADASTATADSVESVFVTLGTAGGPDAQASRAQPANALVVGDDLYLVDAGDGAAGQLVKAGFRVPKVKGLFISHNHFDHTGGVLALLGLRMQLVVKDTLTIYGPPGTQSFIDGLLVGMEPARQAAYGMPGQSWQANVEVKELVAGSVVELNGVTVTVAENTHFKIPESSHSEEKAKSLSFRFDMPDRSIVFTGDTGPSEALEKLAKGADMLISEMMDIPAVLDIIRKVNPNMPQRQLDAIEWHFRAHHVLPHQVGEMAAKAGVERVVVTHMVPNIRDEAMAERYRAEIAEGFDGDIEIANDLDRF
ncbi:MBL fold metallo-hydrolase [Arenicella xantha]|uniref:Ribonuclease BN (tRNA processing enzyme) n=1 Tax=Arenicella xantha TaxID=644221 RepID=A0A395JKM6_9GAMM|nr:MBL fold metallo-hydrolase [Arenicella xantha]RBP47187.1 ribonuclease BN (tRNA processing enzyme) [Arenicella xantha]